MTTIGNPAAAIQLGAEEARAQQNVELLADNNFENKIATLASTYQVERTVPTTGLPRPAGADGIADIGDNDAFYLTSLKIGNRVAAADVRMTGGSAASAAVSTEGASGLSLFHRVLQPLNDFKKNFDETIGKVTKIIGKGNLSTYDLFTIQFEMTKLSFMNDLSSKCADKASQGVQTLFRNQG